MDFTPDPNQYYDSKGREVAYANVSGKIHPKLFSKLVRRSDDGSEFSQQTKIHRYLEGVLRNV
ncbi:hypothetical protein AU509_03010 [Lonsdalea britannica]|uniref:Uncharacterized protein n=1 Tax=Lonsdalea britannica TaxID=1082704 RepID=A0AAD0SK81_9GAMM|nr:hypothetical protein CKQ53_09950 [Lonsdalea britannica]OSM99982.1 hypothetical protein AU509_03010 [Lonsdalea britannica]